MMKNTKPASGGKPVDAGRRKFLKAGAAAVGAGLVVTVAAKDARAADSWGGGGRERDDDDKREGGRHGGGGWDRNRHNRNVGSERLDD